MTTNRFTADNTEGYSAANLATLNEEFAIACEKLDIDADDPDQKSTHDRIAENLLAYLDRSDGVGDRWYSIEAYNTPRIFAWGDENEAALYVDRLNADRDINVYHAREMGLGEAAALELSAALDGSISLHDELAATQQEG